MSQRATLFFIIGLVVPAACYAQTSPTQEDLRFFESKVRPLLVERCYECHSANSEILQGGLRLDSSAGLKAGGDNGPVVEPGEPEQSRLLEAVRYDNVDLQMPPDGQLPDTEVAILQEWIARGAAFPAEEEPLPSAAPRVIDIEAGKQFWSLRPLEPIEVPIVHHRDWVQRPLDAFILARLESEGLKASPAADRRTLIRRLSFDLAGLPPAPDDIDRFVNDTSVDAYERLVDRMLASPHYGERWGRHWLDLVRYCDVPETWAETEAQAWLYRDWVIQALNDDLPYDRFVMQQLAADQLPGANPEDIAALGFFGLSPSYWKELKLAPDVIKNIVAEEWEERIHTFSSTVLGLTVACARCHDHKFDPITQQDYYALAGVFASVRQVSRPLIPLDRAAAVMAAHDEVKRLDEEAKKLREMADKDEVQAEALRQQAADLDMKAKAIREQTPDYSAPLAYAIEDASLNVTNDGPNRTKLEYQMAIGQDVPLHVRGNAAKPSAVVPRRFLSVLSSADPARFTEGSGRRELAESVFRDAAPLAARVIVNRVWRHHFGRGLVDTPSNFGMLGERPTHPELLDDLAIRFIRSGWSLKWLHREMVLSATYQQSSVSTPEQHDRDPANILLSRMNRRRLEVEAWRDAMLCATGTLSPTIGGPAAPLEARQHVRRTIYGQVKRRELHDVLRLYDFPDPTTHSPGRLTTTTPLQQLFVLNSDFISWQAEQLLARLDRECGADQQARIQRAYQLLYGRSPSDRELQILSEALTGAVAATAAEGVVARDVWREVAEVLLASNELMFTD